MKKLRLFLVSLFTLLGVLGISSLNAVDCYDQGAGCITCLDFDASHAPYNSCVSGSGCTVRTTVCGYPEQ